MSGLFAELKRRNVLRAGALYVAAVWALAQGLAQLLPLFGDFDWVVRWLVIAGLIGLPFCIAFAWFYEFTPQGLKRESQVDPADSVAHRTSRKLDYAIIGALAIAVVLLLTDRVALWHDGNEKAVVPERSIAVLPFADMSPGKDQEYFSDGISEELLNLLARIPELEVTARTSSFSFKGKDIAIPAIAKQLHVAHVLEGSVRKAGNTVRITAQLIDAATDTPLWSQTYDRTLDDIFAIQDEIAADVVKQLKLTLLGAPPKTRSTDPEGYALYLQAVQLGRQHTADAYQQSDALYRQALAIDPRYAPAWDGLARNLINESGIGLLSAKQGVTDARAAAIKALAIDPDYAPAHARLGWIAAIGDNDLAAAAQHYQRALALDPTDLGVLGSSATLLRSLGRLNQRLALDQAVVRRDPVNVTALANLGAAQLWAGRFDEAIASLGTALSLSPERAAAHYAIGVALLLKGDAKAALAQMEREPNTAWRMIGLALAYHALERKSEADAALAALIAKFGKDWPYNIAYVYAFRGEANESFTWLAKAVELGDPGLGEVATERLFDHIHADPRWLAFLHTIGRAPEQLAKIEFNVSLPEAAKL